MLGAGAVDSAPMVGRALHFVSIGCCLFVLVSFGLFAHSLASHASSR
jgi:hypothetical protein